MSSVVQRSSHQGALAEYVRVPACWVAPRSSSVSAVEASGFALAGLTAYNALFEVAKLEPGQSIFINGGSTAVGIFAIQLAKAATEPRLRCTEVDENGEVILMDGEFKKTELIAKVSYLQRQISTYDK